MLLLFTAMISKSNSYRRPDNKKLFPIIKKLFLLICSKGLRIITTDKYSPFDYLPPSFVTVNKSLGSGLELEPIDFIICSFDHIISKRIQFNFRLEFVISNTGQLEPCWISNSYKINPYFSTTFELVPTESVSYTILALENIAQEIHKHSHKNLYSSVLGLTYMYPIYDKGIVINLSKIDRYVIDLSVVRLFKIMSVDISEHLFLLSFLFQKMDIKYLIINLMLKIGVNCWNNLLSNITNKCYNKMCLNIDSCSEFYSSDRKIYDACNKSRNFAIVHVRNNHHLITENAKFHMRLQDKYNIDSSTSESDTNSETDSNSDTDCDTDSSSDTISSSDTDLSSDTNSSSDTDSNSDTES